MNVLVAYYSETGNTRRIADAIFDSLPAKKEMRAVDERFEPEGYELVFYGFPVHGHSVPPQATGFFTRFPEGQKVALFSTHGSLREGLLPRQALEHALGLAAKAKVLGHFSCRGRVSPSLLEALEQDPVHRAWVEEARGAYHHPDEHDLHDARSFAAEVMGRLVRR